MREKEHHTKITAPADFNGVQSEVQQQWSNYSYSYVGYERIETKAGGKTELNIVLKKEQTWMQ
jgi:hypothetical protein